MDEEMREAGADRNTNGNSRARMPGILGVLAVVLVFAGFFAAGAWIGSDESLFLAPWWLRIVQFLFSAAMVVGAWKLGKMLPLMPDRNGRPQTPAYGTAWLAFVWCCMMSHAVIWGGLYRAHVGTPATIRCSMVAPGKPSSDHGDCVTTASDGHTSGYRLKTNVLFALPGEGGTHPDRQCDADDAQPNDTLDLIGTRSLLGFAVLRMSPVNDRLARACGARS